GAASRISSGSSNGSALSIPPLPKLPPKLPPKPPSLMVKPKHLTVSVPPIPSTSSVPAAAPTVSSPSSSSSSPAIVSPDLQSPNQIFNKLLKLIQHNNKHAHVDLELPVSQWGLDPSLVG